MFNLVLLFHVIFCVAILALVLLQQGKGADVGAAFGSGSANSMFGSRGPASFLFKLTVSFAVLFFVTSVTLTYLQSQKIKAANALIAPPPAASMSLPTNAPATSTSSGFVPPAASMS